MREIRLTAGNIRNNHIYLSNVMDLFPKDVIGGGNRKRMGRQVLVKTDNGLSFYTDIAGDKKIFRVRGKIGTFFSKSRFKKGDIVIINKISDYEYFLAKKR